MQHYKEFVGIYISLNNIIRNAMNVKNIERKKLLETMKKKIMLYDKKCKIIQKLGK